MSLLETLQELLNGGKSTEELQKEISISEVWHLWELLVARYDVLNTTQLLLAFAIDTDLKLVVSQGLKMLEDQIKQNEDFLQKYGIPLPKKAPEPSHITTLIEEVTDEYIYRRVFRGIQSFIPILSNAFIASNKHEIRNYFYTLLIQELKTYDKLFEYGKLKSWVSSPPRYKE